MGLFDFFKSNSDRRSPKQNTDNSYLEREPVANKHPLDLQAEALDQLHVIAKQNFLSSTLKRDIEIYHDRYMKETGKILSRIGYLQIAAVLDNIAYYPGNENDNFYKKRCLIYLSIILHLAYGGDYGTIQKQCPFIKPVNQEIRDKLVELRDKMILMTNINMIKTLNEILS